MYEKDVLILEELEKGSKPFEYIKKKFGTPAVRGCNGRGYIVNRFDNSKIAYLTITGKGAEALTEHRENVKKK